MQKVLRKRLQPKVGLYRVKAVVFCRLVPGTSVKCNRAKLSKSLGMAFGPLTSFRRPATSGIRFAFLSMSTLRGPIRYSKVKWCTRCGCSAAANWPVKNRWPRTLSVRCPNQERPPPMDTQEKYIPTVFFFNSLKIRMNIL